MQAKVEALGDYLEPFLELTPKEIEQQVRQPNYDLINQNNWLILLITS
jgi:hypothetical protein